MPSIAMSVLNDDYDNYNGGGGGNYDRTTKWVVGFQPEVGYHGFQMVPQEDNGDNATWKQQFKNQLARLKRDERSVNTTREGRHVGQTRRRFNSWTARERSGSAISMYKTSVFIADVGIPLWHLHVTKLLWTQRLILSTVTSLDNVDTHNRQA